MARPDNVAGMARYGINPEGTLGVSMPLLRAAAGQLRPLRRSDPGLVHATAAHLWDSGVHEARILAGLVDIPALVTEAQADAWVADLDSWDTCDQLQKLFVPTPFAYAKAVEWAGSPEVFVKRAGFVLMATLAVHDKAAPDAAIIAFLPVVEAEADRRAELREEGRELGPAADRQALAGLPRRCRRHGRAHPRPSCRLSGRALGGARRLARTTQRCGQRAGGSEGPGFATAAVLITLAQP